MVKRQNDVKFSKDGGTIVNRKSGRIIRFHEHEGVYFLKLRVSDPSLFTDNGADPMEVDIQSMDTEAMPGFHRPGHD